MSKVTINEYSAQVVERIALDIWESPMVKKVMMDNEANKYDLSTAINKTLVLLAAKLREAQS